jgi:hypothetical protein
LSKYLKNAKGLSLVELSVAMGLTGIIALSGAFIIQAGIKQSHKIEIKADAQQKFVLLTRQLINNEIWQASINDAGNGDLNQCLREANPDRARCIDSDNAGPLDAPEGFLLRVAYQDGSLLHDFNDASRGFNIYGESCSTFDEADVDEDCPFRLRAFWKMECPNDVSITCDDPIVVISVKAENHSIRYMDLNFDIFNTVIVKEAKKSLDSVAVLCESLDAIYNPATRTCNRNFNDFTCPIPGTYITRIDSDGTITCTNPTPTCEFALASSSYDEGTMVASVQVDMSAARTNDATLNFNVTGGSATNVDDYSPNSGSVVIRAGDTSELININIVNDANVEGDENIVLTLTSADARCLIGAQDTHDLTITDNDGSGEFYFTNLTSSVTDSNNQTLTLDVNLSAPYGVATQVQYTISGGTAQAADYNFTAGTLNFAPGDMTESFSIDIVGDALVEGVETIILTLQNPVGGPTLRAGESSHTITLTDDPTVYFSAATSDVLETDGAQTVQVNLSFASASPVTVNCNLNNAMSSATAGTDFNFVNQNIVFNPGETTKTCDYTLIDDAPTVDAGETIVLDLSGVSGALLGTPTRHTVTVGEPNRPPVLQCGCSGQVTITRRFDNMGDCRAERINQLPVNIGVLQCAQCAWPTPQTDPNPNDFKLIHLDIQSDCI